MGDSKQPGRRHKSPEKKSVLRDHAPAQPAVAWTLETRIWPDGGAPAPPRRAGLWQPDPAAAPPDAAPPATGELHSDTPDPDSTAGSIAGGRTCAHTLYAGTSVAEVVGLWQGNGKLDYRGECPRERVFLPREVRGECLLHSLRALIKTGARQRVYERSRTANKTAEETD